MSPLNIVLDPIKVPGILAVKMWINGGSKEDPSGQRGAHQLLGSVISRGCGPYSNKTLANLVEGCGAGLRCDTHEDGLLISLKCSDNDAGRLLPAMGWMIMNPHLQDDQISLERELSLQALQRQKENPFQLTFDGWRQLAYGDGPYGHDPLGFVEDVKNLSRKDLLPLAEKLINREHVIAIAGTCNSNLKKQLQETTPFNQLTTTQSSGYKCSKKQNLIVPRPNPNNISLHSEQTGQVVLMLGQPTIPHGHKDDLALRMLSCYLGTGMSSLLFRKLRENHGVAYDVGVHHPIREEAAPFLIHVSTSEEKALLTLQLLQEILGSIKTNKVSNDDMILIQSKFQGQLAHASQTVSQRAERKAILRGLKLGNNFDKESIEKIKSITSKDIQVTAEKYLSRPLLSLCGPEATIKSLSKRWKT